MSMCKQGHLFEGYCKVCKAAYYEANKEKLNLQTAQWKACNKEYYAQYNREYGKIYASKNRSTRNAYVARRKARLLESVPTWYCDKDCKAIYKEAQRLKLTVDHIIPLQGELVSGLHWAHNLQMLPASENCSKSNKFDPDTYIHELPATITA